MVLIDGRMLDSSDLLLQYLPVRGHDKEKVSEDRHGRQYHPYDSQHGRNNKSDGQGRDRDLGRQKRQDSEHKPIASFQLAYK